MSDTERIDAAVTRILNAHNDPATVRALIADLVNGMRDDIRLSVLGITKRYTCKQRIEMIQNVANHIERDGL